MVARTRELISRNSLWLVGLGLMLASSGIDGAYMERWNAWRFGGYVFNTVADVAGMALTYWYGRLQMDRSRMKRRLSRILIGAEVIAVAFSWFFSWRQLLIVLPEVEGEATRWIAPIAAGFIPLLLAFVGYAQSLLAGRIESEAEPSQRARQSQAATQTFAPKLAVSEPPVASRSQTAFVSDAQANRGSDKASHTTHDNGHERHTCPHCGRSDFATPQAVSAHLRWCDAYKREQSA